MIVTEEIALELASKFNSVDRVIDPSLTYEDHGIFVSDGDHAVGDEIFLKHPEELLKYSFLGTAEARYGYLRIQIVDDLVEGGAAWRVPYGTDFSSPFVITDCGYWQDSRGNTNYYYDIKQGDYALWVEKFHIRGVPKDLELLIEYLKEYQ